MPPTRDRALFALLLLAALLGLAYNAAILLGYGPDEPRHLAYVELLFREHAFPRQNPDGSEYAGAHSYHPPLYYFVLLPFYALGRALPHAAMWHGLRLVSQCLCLLSLPLIWQIARRAGGGDRAFAALVVAQIALLPIFGMTEGIVNNDSALLLAVSVFLWLLAARYPDDVGFKSALALGLCGGLGGLCKGTAFICDFAAPAAYLWAQDGARGLRSPRPWLRFALAVGVAAAVAGPWYARNVALYGSWQPVPRGFSPADMGWLPRAEYGPVLQMFHPNFPPLVGRATWGIFYSLWSQKDWIPPAVRLGVYLLLAAYCLAALVGAARRKWGRRPCPEDAPGPMGRAERVALWSTAAAFAVTALACLQIALFVHWGQAEGGRYLLPAVVGLSIPLARGWRGLVGARRLPALTLVWGAALLSLNGVAFYWLLHYLNPTFGPKG